MTCPRCNAIVSKRDEVCPLCGEQLNTQQPQQTFQQPVNQQPQQTFNQQQPSLPQIPKPQKSSKPKIILAVIGVLAVIGTGLAISSGNDSSATDEPLSFNSQGDLFETQEKTTESASVLEQENILSEYSSLVSPDGYIDGGTKSVEPSIGLRLRYGPSESYDIITVLPQGTTVDIIGISGVEGWVYVYCNNLKMNGWVSEEYLSNSSYKSDKLAVSYYTTTYTSRVEPSVGLNLRNGPSESYDVITLLPCNKSVTVMGQSTYDKKWLYVQTNVNGNDIYGFLYSDYLN